MKEAETLEETLDGGYAGLYGEVVANDTYRLKQLDFVPDVVFDIGANVGVFSRYARTLFPKALIVALEPHPENCFYFRKFTSDSNLILLPKALGTSRVYRCEGAVNGAGESYLSAGLGYSSEGLRQDSRMRRSSIPTTTLGELAYTYWKSEHKVLVKIDCEGAENSIWLDSLSMVSLLQTDYICIELHDYSLTHDGKKEVVEVTQATLRLLEATHTCERDDVYFLARKK